MPSEQTNGTQQAPASAPAATGPTGGAGTTGGTGGPATKMLVKSEDAATQAYGYVEKYGLPALSVLIIVFVSWVVSGWTRRVVRRGLDRAHFDLTLSKFLSNMVRWVILAIAAIMCLNKFGVETTSFAALIGATGLAIGLGFQGSLANLAAGVMLLVFRPFKVGDGIAVAGQAGVVNEIDLFTTTLDTADGRRIIMPNGPVFGSVIENTTYHPRRRLDIAVVAAGPLDMDRIRATLIQAAAGTSGVLTDPPPDAVALDMGGNWSVQAWVKTSDAGAVRQALIRSLKQAMATPGMSPPKPSTDVNIVALPEGARLPG